MKNLNFYHVGSYNRPVHHIQQNVQHLFLMFHLSGLEYFSTKNFKTDCSTPFLYLFFPGDVFEFEYNENRQDWVAQFDYPGIKFISKKQFSFKLGDKNIILPRYLEITQNDVLHLQNKFDSLIKIYTASTMQEQMLAQLYLLDILRYYIEATGKERQTCSAAKLKQLLDMPENMHFSISELSKKCDYCIDHLRMLFKNKYGISPQEYRIRHSMTYAMELICKSDLTVSNVAEKCGFEYLSRFSRSFKKVHGMSPSEALKRFRYK